MNVLLQLLGGLVGAAVGAGAWAALRYYGGIQTSYVGLFIPVFAVLGVRAAGRDGLQTTRTVATILATLVGFAAFKGVMVYVALTPTTETYRLFAISDIAEVIIEEQESQGRAIEWPGGRRPDVVLPEEYPPEIYQRATERWVSLSKPEQEDLLAAGRLANPEYPTVEIARQLAADHERSEWPHGQDRYSAWLRSHFPAEVWTDALQRWEALAPDQKETYRSAAKAAIIARQAKIRELIIGKLPGKLAFTIGAYSISALDLVTATCMIGVAYFLSTIGANESNDEPELS